METILKVNRIPFKGLDIATDEKARMLWGRRAGKDESGRPRKIPGLVQMGLVIGDLVEVEDWNEYGELKQHVKIVGDSNMTPVRTPAATPSGTPSKTVAQKENTKPEPALASTSKQVEEPKSSIPEPTPITLALRQAGQEAAQKAKENKKKPMETFSGVGKAEAAKEEEAVPAPVSVGSSEKHTIEDNSSLQSPNSTAWKTASRSMNMTIPPPSMDKLESLQSPNTGAWKSTDVNPPILTHRGSTISTVSDEEIKQIEEEETIPEEDEDEEDDEDDE